MPWTARLCLAAAAFWLSIAALADPTVASAATLNVTVTRDPSLAGSRACSLREAIATVDSPGTQTPCGRAGRSANTIRLRAGRYRLSVNPSAPDDNSSGDLDITSASLLTITGAGHAATAIDASGLGDRVLSIARGARVSVTGLTVLGGQAAGTGACVPGSAANLGGSGGGILNAGALTLTDTVVRGNAAATGGSGLGGCAAGDGGGIENLGRLTLRDSTVRDDRAGSGGTGGAGGNGGGIDNHGALSLSGSIVVGNQAGAGGSGGGGAGGPGGAGGGLFSAGDHLTVTNSTYAGNVAGAGGSGAQGGTGGGGGAIAVVRGAGTVLNVTIARNSAGSGGPGATGLGTGGRGGGIAVLAESVLLQNSIVASNAGENCVGTPPGAIVDGGHNLTFGDRTCPGTYADPGLGAPQDNGGPTDTMALRRGSPAINRVPNRRAHCPAADQRGVARPQLGACDIGAYEFAVPTISIITPNRRGSYEHLAHIRVHVRCSEGGITSAIETCRTTGRGDTLNTRSTGEKTFRVVAVDKAGARSMQTVRYDVWAYVNPLSRVGGLGQRRIDMGVDYSGSGPILALGDARITFASNTDDGPPSCWGITCWPGGGAVVYRLLNGPYSGKYVYCTEHITVTVRAGTMVKAGQPVATLHFGYPNLEIGWGSGRGPETLAIADGHQAGGDPGGWSGIEGRNFNNLLVRLGAPPGFLQAGVPNQSMPRGWPRLPGRVN